MSATTVRPPGAGTAAGAAPDSLSAAAKGLVDGLEVVDLRRLLAQVLGAQARGRNAMAMLLSVDALHVCFADQGQVSTHVDYEGWRGRQERPDQYPSAEFILAHCDGWTMALTFAGLPTAPTRRMMRRNRAFTQEEAAESIRAWLADVRDDDLAFRAYRSWVVERLAEDENLSMPTHSLTFDSLFGGWHAAIDYAYPDAKQARETARARQEAATRERLLADLRRALAYADTQGQQLTRARYDAWAREQEPVVDGWRPRSSFTYQRHFGTWAQAVRMLQT